jgi:hypothetical protein
MRFAKPLRPRLESLEKKTVLSAGASAAPGAFIGAVERPQSVPAVHPILSLSNAATLTSTQVKLSGQAKGIYTSRQENPDTGVAISRARERFDCPDRAGSGDRVISYARIYNQPRRYGHPHHRGAKGDTASRFDKLRPSPNGRID